jgi:bacteriorhodopsin
MPDLSTFEYNLVYNLFSFTFASMFAAFVFFVLARQQIAPQYRNALVMSALVVAVAGYHYFRIFESWSAAYTLVDGTYIATGEPFNDAYRYIDWLLTVPLLVAELVYVINPKNRGRLTFTLATAAALMVILGYPGEVADSNTTRAVWGFLSTLPFVYIVWQLFSGLTDAIDEQPEDVKPLVRNIRLLLLGTWGFYPLVYMLPFLGITSSVALVGIQVGYCLADVAAKAGYGIMIYVIAAKKSEAAGYTYDSREPVPAAG